MSASLDETDEDSSFRIPIAGVFDELENLVGTIPDGCGLNSSSWH